MQARFLDTPSLTNTSMITMEHPNEIVEAIDAAGVDVPPFQWHLMVDFQIVPDGCRI